MNYTQHFSTRTATQDQPIPGTAQVQNSDGCFTWAVDDWTRLERFLVLGSEGGSYYASERKLTVENAAVVQRCLAADGPRTVNVIAKISDEGRAPKNDQALFALAMAAGAGGATAQAALLALPAVARTGTHLFQFLEMVQAFRGWGRSLRKAIATWYQTKQPEALAYQLCKYRQRNGWSHRDALRLAHPIAPTPEHQALFLWATKGDMQEPVQDLVSAFQYLQCMVEVDQVVQAIQKHKSLSWEMVPTQHLSSPKVWEALLPHLPLNALVRNLGRMTANGLIGPMSQAAGLIAAKLGDAEHIKKSRLHPLAVLVALATYKSGKGMKGSLTWSPNSLVVDALDQAFYHAFGNVTSTGKRTLLALDVSGSMSSPSIAGTCISPRVASAAMAMVTARTEPQHAFVAFSSGLVGLSISPRQRLDDVVKTISSLPFSSTDCSLPMVWAAQERVPVDTFCIYTDSDTNHGRSIHPALALRQYRERMGIPAKLVVVGMVSNGFTIADPNDAGMLDVVGFDTAAPEIISGFSKG